MSTTTKHLMKRALDVIPSTTIDSVQFFKMVDIVKLIDLADNKDALMALIKSGSKDNSQ